MIKLQSLREVALEYSEEDSSNNFKERIWRLTSPIVSFGKIGSFSANNNAALLPSHDVLFNMAINYLEIWEIFRFAKCCKLIYSSLFNDEELFWREISKRDGFISTNDEITTGQECCRKYCNLWASCLEFETKSNSAFVESNTFSLTTESNNPQLFQIFRCRIKEDFNQIMYILRSDMKSRFLIKVHLVAFAMNKFYRDEFSKKLHQKNLKEMFYTLSRIENGATLEVGMNFKKIIVSNLLGLAFETSFKYLSDEFKEEVENSFIKYAAFRVACPSILTIETFLERAIKIIESRMRDNYNFNELYKVLSYVFENPKRRLKSADNFSIVFKAFESCRREDSISLIVGLLRKNDSLGKFPIHELVCTSLTWFHPLIFEEIMSEKYYSSGCKEYYFETLSRVITSTDEIVEMKMRKRALERICFLCNEPTIQIIGSTPYKSLKSIEQTELALTNNEFNDCLFNIWRKTKSIPDKQMIHDLVKKYNKKAFDLMLEMRPLPFDPKSESSIAEEVFEALKSYGMTLEETDKECQQFHWKFTEFFVNYCSYGEFKDSYLVQLMFRYLSMKYQNGVTTMIQAIQYADKRIQIATSSKMKK